MIGWLAKAKASFSETPTVGTAKTDERGVSSVSSVGVVTLFENHALSSELLEVAMRAAAHWKDDPEAWLAQCLEVPPHLHGDLLDHLTKTYPPK